MDKMKITIELDIPNARKVLALSSGSPEECENYLHKMSDIEIKDTIIRHIKCWAIKEVEKENP